MATRSRAFRLAGLLAALALVAVAAPLLRAVYFPDLPAPQRAARQVDLNWHGEAASRRAFYHLPQGSLLLPYSWFLALEQFSVLPLHPRNWRPFRDPDHLARFRLLASPPSAENPDGLPVGLARTEFDDPQAGGEYLGLTCAACHTGELHYRGVALRVDGGSGMLNLNELLERAVVSLAVTVSPLRPWKFRRFAAAVLGEDNGPAARLRLRREVLEFLGSQFARGHRGTLEGTLLAGKEFGRMDALATGGNRVFMQLDERNFAAPRASAVVAPLWGAYEYDWGLSNGAVRQPLARNVIQAIALNAYVDLQPGPRRYLSSVQLDNMARLGRLVAELPAPVWPEEILGPIDAARARRGRQLFARRCAGCHLPERSVESSPPDPVSEALGRELVALAMLPVEKIGTDPTVARNFAARRVVGAEALGLPVDERGETDAAAVIRAVVSGVMERYYREAGIGRERQLEWGGERSDLWRARLAYSARPLAGVWATPPYLHNGSVPNVFQLLSPVSERDRLFWVGNLEYDPERLGYRTERLAGTTRVDVLAPGGSNCGHEFRDPSTPAAAHCRDPQRDASRGRARIGPGLTVEERWSLIEYLKSLRPEPLPRSRRVEAAAG